MTNFEKNLCRIKELAETGCAIGIKDGNLVFCEDIEDCSECGSFRDGGKDCTSKLLSWLISEYEEPEPKHKLTKAERGFCEVMTSGYIARDQNNDLMWYKFYDEPVRGEDEWECCDLAITLNKNHFGFITFEDNEPWSIAELLKLEVEE